MAARRRRGSTPRSGGRDAPAYGAKERMAQPLRAAGGTQTLTSIAKGLAAPALILAVLLGIIYLLGKSHW